MTTAEKDPSTSRSSAPWPRIAVIGAGAVGGYFGGMLARAGAPVIFIGRQSFVDAVKANGLFLDTVQFQEHVKANASPGLSAARACKIILFFVTTVDTAETARQLARLLPPNALIVSLQNGVDNAEQIHAASGLTALAAAVYVAASVPSPGTVKHVGRGDLVLGPKNISTEMVAEVFLLAGVPCKISDNLAGELWTKLVWNCALNAISALGKTTYGDILASADAKKLVEEVVYEVLAVAEAAGISLPAFADPQVAIATAYKIAEQMATTPTSTPQDMMRNKKLKLAPFYDFILHP